MLTIAQAVTESDITAVRELMLEYAQWLEFKLCFQGFKEELETLPGKYAPPAGRLLLARWDGRVAGIGALRPLDEPGVCEMKRLYLRPEFRGHGIGGALAGQLIRDAGEIGYTRICLETVPGKMDRAIALYRQIGFQEISPYYAAPAEHTLFMELKLRPAFALDENARTRSA